MGFRMKKQIFSYQEEPRHGQDSDEYFLHGQMPQNDMTRDCEQKHLDQGVQIISAEQLQYFDTDQDIKNQQNIGIVVFR